MWVAMGRPFSRTWITRFPSRSAYTRTASYTGGARSGPRSHTQDRVGDGSHGHARRTPLAPVSAATPSVGSASHAVHPLNRGHGAGSGRPPDVS